jgi:hypothetical protein
MTVVFGVSQAWKSVCSQIPRDFECATPDQLQQLISTQRQQREQWAIDAAALVTGRQDELQSRSVALAAKMTKVKADAAARVSPEMASIGARRKRLESASLTLVRWFNRWIRIPPLSRRLAWLHHEPDRAAQGLSDKLQSVTADLAQIHTQRQAQITRIIREWEHRLHILEALVVSPEYAGALAELEMTNILRRLPETFTILNDVSIKMAKWAYADGEHRKSAQIDHVVVGPGSVFVIEVKLWSAKFANSGDYYDPYTQVHWAGKLCHFFLSDALGRKVRVREIIATAGRLPQKPTDNFVKILQPHKVSGYVMWFKPELDQQLMEQIVVLLRRQC